MKTLIVSAVVAVIVFSSLRSLVNSFRKGTGCSSCPSSKGNSCKVKKSCPSNSIKK